MSIATKKKDKHFCLSLRVRASVYLQGAKRRDSEPSEFTHIGERHSHGVSSTPQVCCASHNKVSLDKKKTSISACLVGCEPVCTCKEQSDEIVSRVSLLI